MGLDKLAPTKQEFAEAKKLLEGLNTAETKKQKGLLRSMAQEQSCGWPQDRSSEEQVTSILREVRHIPDKAKVGKERNWVVARAGLEQEGSHRSLLVVDREDGLGNWVEQGGTLANTRQTCRPS